MIGPFERYDAGRRPNRQWRILTPLAWLISFSKVWAHRGRIDKTGLPKDLKPPYFLLCNHNSFLDFMIMTKAIFPRRANYVVAIDGFIGMEWLLRAVGGIGNRKFTRDIRLVKNMLHARNKGNIVILFPEARYSFCGTSAALPASLGKMVRLMHVPVVTLIMHGHHVNSPLWQGGNRKVKPVKAEMKLLCTQEETRTLSVEEINARLAEVFSYDDYAWQKKEGIRIRAKNRAEGLHRILYQCPACYREYRMTSEKNMLKCTCCGKVWEMSELGELRAQTGETEFPHIPDWFAWERANVRREVETNTYSFEAEVRIEALPNIKGFVVFDQPGRLTHGADGFHLSGTFEGEPFQLHWSSQFLNSCHIEYNYKKRGDCVDLSTSDDSFFLFPKNVEFSVTKIALATEELHRHRVASRVLAEKAQ